ncbi:MAG: aldose epimerase [Acidimicrobiales bacterium]|nr:aldose epimerase [Acidimicrobiales bacterium]
MDDDAAINAGFRDAATAVISSDRLRVEVDAAAGGRLSSLRADGHEILVTGTPVDDPMRWGSFPMVPWAGRVSAGRFVFDGTVVQLPLGLPPHAIHGTGYVRPWTITDRTDHSVSLLASLGPDWPFAAEARQEVLVDGARLCLTLEVHALEQQMPAMVGWHPWFRRQVGEGAPLELEFAAAEMYARDDAGIPNGKIGAPPAGPWDDCFRAVTGGPVLRWPGLGALHLRSSCDHWVVYDEPEHALCVEPQSDAPDAFNRSPHLVRPGQPLVEEFELRWER